MIDAPAAAEYPGSMNCPRCQLPNWNLLSGHCPRCGLDMPLPGATGEGEWKKTGIGRVSDETVNLPKPDLTPLCAECVVLLAREPISRRDGAAAHTVMLAIDSRRTPEGIVPVILVCG